MDFGSRFGTFGRDGTNNNNMGMTTHEYQALIKTLTLKERFELNQRKDIQVYDKVSIDIEFDDEKCLYPYGYRFSCPNC